MNVVNEMFLLLKLCVKMTASFKPLTTPPLATFPVSENSDGYLLSIA